MSTRRWILVFAAAALLLALLSIFLLRGEHADTAEVWLDGERIAVLPLAVDTEMTVQAPDGGWNRIVVSGGAVAVTEADCPDGVCVARGAARGGAPIVCLPHRLVIRFTGSDTLDGIAG